MCVCVCVCVYVCVRARVSHVSRARAHAYELHDLWHQNMEEVLEDLRATRALTPKAVGRRDAADA